MGGETTDCRVLTCYIMLPFFPVTATERATALKLNRSVLKKHLVKGGSLRLSLHPENEKKIPGTEVLKMTMIGFEPPAFCSQVQRSNH